MKIKITKIANICPAPRIGEILDVINTSEQLSEFIKTHGKMRYHAIYRNVEIVICEKECEIID